MNGIPKIIWSFFFLTLGSSSFEEYKYNEVQHAIKVIHPGISLTNAVDCVLIETWDVAGKPKTFSMNVESVVCGDSQCRIDIVQIVWNNIGKYEKFILPQGVELEKAKGEHFNKKDYEKLHKILNNEKSPLKEVYKEEVVGTVGSEGVDALSGETILLDKTSYVKGAVWTCYSLWHWVHGDVQNHIRSITGKSFSRSELISYLKSKDKEFQRFALEELLRRKAYSADYIEQVRLAIKKNPALIELGLQYFENASALIFEENIMQLLNFSTPKNRELCLQYVSKFKGELSSSFLERLIEDLSSSNSFQEINTFLNILSHRKATSEELINKLFPFLKNDNFLIARRIYWFLSKEKLLTNQQEKLDAFFVKHENKL